MKKKKTDKKLEKLINNIIAKNQILLKGLIYRQNKLIKLRCDSIVKDLEEAIEKFKNANP